MKNLVLSVAAAFLTITACQEKESQNTVHKDHTESSEQVDMHTSRNSLDWMGSYFGTLPCASCPGINQYIILNENDTYQISSDYIGEEGPVMDENGSIVWTEDGSTIQLGESFYRVEENQLRMIGADGNEVTGDMAENYVLKKYDLQAGLDVNDGFEAMLFNTADGREVQIIYNTNPEIPQATVVFDEETYLLNQSEAWAKGAEYQREDVKLHAGQNETSLQIGDEIYNLEEK